MKSFTNLEQSKELAEILPLESADMYYTYGDETEVQFGEGFYEELKNWSKNGSPRPVDVPCWSLAALLSVLPKSALFTPNPFDNGYSCKNLENDIEVHDSNPIDACVTMIEKLHKEGLL